MTGSNNLVIQHHSSSAVQVDNETNYANTSTNTEAQSKKVRVTEITNKLVQKSTIDIVESCKRLDNIGVLLYKENQKNSDAQTNMCHDEKKANHHHGIKLTKNNWLNQMGTNTPIESLSPGSLSSTEINSDNSEAGFLDENDVGLKCLSTVLNLDKEHNMFGLSSYGNVVLQRPRQQPKPRNGKPVFHQTTIIHACCTAKCGPPKKGCKSKCCTPNCCNHVSNSDLPSSLKMGAGSCRLGCASPPPCHRTPSGCAKPKPCIYTCGPEARARSCSRKCLQRCSQPCLPCPRLCPPKPGSPKPCGRPYSPKPCSRPCSRRPCSRTFIRPCPRPCAKPNPARRRPSGIEPYPLPKFCLLPCKTICSPCFGMKVTEKNAVVYEPSPVEIIPRAPCIMSKPLMARPCPHCPPCMPHSGCYPCLMPCYLPARPGAPCTEPGRCFHTPPCPAPRATFDPRLSDGSYKSPCPKSCDDFNKGRKDTTKKCPIVICPGNNPEFIDAIRKVYGGKPVKENESSK